MEIDKRLIVLLKRSADEIKKTVIGKDDIIIKILMTACAGGHILLEDIPGVGKTTMAVAFSKALSLKYNRMQFTSDVMPADVTGFYMPNRATGEFDFKPGAVFCNLFLADEINRTSSKTQSALLEAMEEGAVTVDSVTRKLPDPFIVLATQNPSGSAGTQLLPESQLDRFMIRLSMGYPTVGEETEILKAKSSKKAAPRVNSIMTAQDLIEIRSAAEDIFVSDEIYDYIARLSGATRSDRRLMGWIDAGAWRQHKRLAGGCGNGKVRRHVQGQELCYPRGRYLCLHRCVRPQDNPRKGQGQASLRHRGKGNSLRHLQRGNSAENMISTRYPPPVICIFLLGVRYK